MSYEINVVDDFFRRLEPALILQNDPRSYLGDLAHKCSFKVRSYYNSNFKIKGYIVVWDLNHKNYNQLIQQIGT